MTTFNRQIRGLILQLIAVDFTVAMNGGHIEIPKNYLTVLLSANEEQSRAILWSLMYNSISASLELKPPAYRNFEMSRVEDVKIFNFFLTILFRFFNPACVAICLALKNTTLKWYILC